MKILLKILILLKFSKIFFLRFPSKKFFFSFNFSCKGWKFSFFTALEKYSTISNVVVTRNLNANCTVSDWWTTVLWCIRRKWKKVLIFPSSSTTKKFFLRCCIFFSTAFEDATATVEKLLTNISRISSVAFWVWVGWKWSVYWEEGVERRRRFFP